MSSQAWWKYLSQTRNQDTCSLQSDLGVYCWPGMLSHWDGGQGSWKFLRVSEEGHAPKIEQSEQYHQQIRCRLSTLLVSWSLFWDGAEIPPLTWCLPTLYHNQEERCKNITLENACFNKEGSSFSIRWKCSWVDSNCCEKVIGNFKQT